MAGMITGRDARAKAGARAGRTITFSFTRCHGGHGSVDGDRSSIGNDGLCRGMCCLVAGWAVSHCCRALG